MTENQVIKHRLKQQLHGQKYSSLLQTHRRPVPLPFIAFPILVRPAQLNTTSPPGPRQFTLCKKNGPRRPYQSSPVMQRDRTGARRLQPLKERTLRRQVYGSQWQESPFQLPRCITQVSQWLSLLILSHRCNIHKTRQEL